MRIDPVVVLMDELDSAQALLARARKDKDWRATRRQLAIIASLHAVLCETEPTTVIGAAHLLRQAAVILRRAMEPYYCDRLCQIAGRLDEGGRALSDLVWLREAERVLAVGVCGGPGQGAAPLVRLALRGAARPVLLYRAVDVPSQRNAPAQSKIGG